MDKTAKPVTYIKPVNLPELMRVEEDREGHPVAVRARRRQKVAAINDCWRVDDEWWRSEPVSRMYYSLVLDTGQRLVVFKDLLGGRWYKQGY